MSHQQKQQCGRLNVQHSRLSLLRYEVSRLPSISAAPRFVHEFLHETLQKCFKKSL